MHNKKVLIFQQMDPLGSKIGGIETLVRNFIKYAPENFDIEFVGVSTGKKVRNIGMWHEVELFHKKIKFLPIVLVHDETVRTKIPLSLRFTLALFRHRAKIPLEGRILKFHRIEPSLPFRKTRAKKILFVHGNIVDMIYNPRAEVKWSKFPYLYFKLEKYLINQFDKIFSEREDGIRFYKRKYPRLRDRFSFLPTWVDEETFYPFDNVLQKKKRAEFIREQGFSGKDKLILSVGRLDEQKDPLLLVDTFNYVTAHIPNSRLLVVGAGVLKDQMVKKIKAHKLNDNVTLFGALPQSESAELMRISDLFLLTSGFEGMPLSVLEALACGLPVVSPDVGEVRRVVRNGFSGIISSERNPFAMGDAVIKVLRSGDFPKDNCVLSIQNYTAKQVLANVYQFLNELK
jgi:glycosyltransferase involved in cell wall biosynthesis